MFTASDLRKGLRIEIDGAPYVITDFNFQKPGKGTSIYTCKIKNLITGSTQTKTYRPNDRIDKPNLTEKTLVYSYDDGDNYIFTDKSYNEVILSVDVLDRGRYFLSDDIEVRVLYHNETPIEVVFPFFVEKAVVHTEPGARGNTATNVLKPATVEGGYELGVPIFVNVGDVLRIDTRTGEYVERVRG